MTNSTVNNLQNIGAVLCFLVPCLQAVFRQHVKWYKRITWMGWGLLVVSVYIFIVSYYGDKVHNKEQEQSKKIADSTRKADRDTVIKSVQDALKEHNLRYDSERKAIVYIKTDSTNYYGVPDIELTGSNAFHAAYTSKADTIFYTISLGNLSNTDAYNFRMKIYVLGVGNREYYNCTIVGLIDSGATFNAHQSYEYNPGTTMYSMPKFDSVYLFIVATYSNYFRKVNKEYKECIGYSFSTNHWSIPPLNRKQQVARMLKIKY